MIAAGVIVEKVLEANRRTESDEARALVYSLLNGQYFDLCRRFSLVGWRREITLDFTTADETGLWLPSNVFGIDRVRDAESSIEFFPRDKADIDPDEDGYRYSRYVPDDDPLFFGEDLEIEEGATTFESASLGSDDNTGEYVSFADQPGFYLLSAAKTFSPTYYGPDISQGEFSIRPQNTEKIVIYDPSEEVLTDREVTAYVWVAPRPIYHASDIIVLPHTKYLELVVMKEAMEIIGKRQISANTYDAQIREALQELHNANPQFPRAPRPRDAHNAVYENKTVPFKRRS